jgi:hypothetical protein
MVVCGFLPGNVLLSFCGLKAEPSQNPEPKFFTSWPASLLSRASCLGSLESFENFLDHLDAWPMGKRCLMEVPAAGHPWCH